MPAHISNPASSPSLGLVLTGRCDVCPDAPKSRPLTMASYRQGFGIEIPSLDDGNMSDEEVVLYSRSPRLKPKINRSRRHFTV